jgi:hypothetical protein
MDRPHDRNEPATTGQGTSAPPFRFPVAPSHYDRLLAAAHDLALDVLASTSAAPVIDADACAAWLAADFARDRRDAPRPERRGTRPDRRRS